MYTKLLLSYPELNSFLINNNQNKYTKVKKNTDGHIKKQKCVNMNFDYSYLNNINGIGYISNFNQNILRNQNFSYSNIRNNISNLNNQFLNCFPNKKI